MNQTSVKHQSIMRNNFYFPLEVNLLSDKNIAELIDKKGARGFGIYIMILIELRRIPDFKGSTTYLKSIARKYRIPIKLLNEVIFDYKLFEISEEDDLQIIASYYLNRVMKVYNERIEKYAKAGRKNSDKAKRNSKGQFTNNDGSLELEQELE